MRIKIRVELRIRVRVGIGCALGLPIAQGRLRPENQMRTRNAYRMFVREYVVRRWMGAVVGKYFRRWAQD